MGEYPEHLTAAAVLVLVGLSAYMEDDFDPPI
jgi:hypothetical protein